MKRILQTLLFLLIVISCRKEDSSSPKPDTGNPGFISAVDISAYPEISLTNPAFYNSDGHPKDFLALLKENGVNTIRLRLWVNPGDEHSGFKEVKQFSQILKNTGFKVWITLHYSDTWADPENQETPLAWQGLDFNTLRDSVSNYTQKVITEINPDYVQIGNEINSGMLHPHGDIATHPQDFLSLVEAGCDAVRQNSNTCKIILHFAGMEHSDWFFNQVKTIDYDIIGLSYYPIWHGKSLNDLENTMYRLSESHHKQIVIAETAYPFTLAWNDWTDNIVGLEEQLILPEYPATPEGQRKFVQKIKTLVQGVEKGIGWCYWGAELIAWKGNQSTDASPWENQALFDFNNTALPVLAEFKE